jgi:serine/threonine-protein kinase
MGEQDNNGGLDPEKMQGQELAGCRILEKIATGGMGTVYRALQMSMNRQVAIKCLAEDFARDKNYVQRFVREARAAGELSHTHLIHVLDVGQHQGVYYYIMEYVDGQSVDRVLRIKERLGPETVTEIVMQTARALAYAHERNIIHRDIKPDNLMITKDGTVKLADLGIAKKLDPNKEATDAGLVLGTPNYMAPEQAQDSSLTDRRSDVYALGSTAYHMLTGRPPYTGKNALEVLSNLVKKRPTPVEKLRPEVPKGLILILNKMMARDPEKRYQGMPELVKDLELYKAGKYQPEQAVKGGRPTWKDEDEEEDPQAKAPLEIAETAPEAPPSATKGPASSAGGTTTESVKLSGTRVVSNPSLGTAELVAARAIGAISAKPKNKWIPLIYLVGALAMVGIAWTVAKKMMSEKKDPNQNGGLPVRVVEDLPDKEHPQEEQARVDLREAETTASRPGVQRQAVWAAFDDCAKRYPDTNSGKKAAARAEEFRADWKTAIDGRLGDVERALRASVDGVTSYKPVESAISRALSEAENRPEFLKMVDEARKKADAEVAAKAAEIMKSAREKHAAKDLLGAINEGLRVRSLEVDRLWEEAAKLVSGWREAWIAEILSGTDKWMPAWREACQWAQAKPEDAKGDMRFDKALEILSKAPVARAIASRSAEDVAAMKTAQAGYKQLFVEATALAGTGKKVKFSKDAFPNNEMVEIKRVVGDTIYIEWHDKELRLRRLTAEDVLTLCRPAWEANAAGRLILARWHFVQGELREARAAIAGVALPAADDLRRRINLEEIWVVERRSEVREMLSVQESGSWGEQVGSWRRDPKDNSAIIGAGDSGHMLIASPPGEKYSIEVLARHEDGINGCGVHFTAWGSKYLWHIGDAGNTKSWVRGLPGTETTDVMTSGDPVLLKVVVLADRAIGFLNGEQRWEILKSTPGAPTAGEGLGFGVSRCKVRFTNIRLLKHQN